MTRLLIIEDDAKLAELLKDDFELEDYAVVVARDGVQGLEKAREIRPDLILLDVMLPKLSGYDVCRTLRKEGCLIPILMLTAKGQETEKVVGLDMGADDYLSKPFGSLELLARVKALLRRHQRSQAAAPVLEVDGLRVDFARMEVTKNAKPLTLTLKEFKVLELLVRRRGDVVSRKDFLEEVWGYDALPSTRTVDNTIFTLRQKLSAPKKSLEDYIVAVHGVGYRFVK